MLCRDILMGWGAGEREWRSSDSDRTHKDALTCENRRLWGVLFLSPVRTFWGLKAVRRTSGDRYPSMNSVVKLEHKDVDAIPFQEASLDIWDKKYRLSAKDGTPVDKTMDDTYKRVARALADVEA